MKTKHKLLLLLMLLTTTLAISQKDSDFYTETINNYSSEVNLKTDYNVNGNGNDTDSKRLQQAIDDANAAGGGVIYLPQGTYKFSNISITSNVHLKIQAGTEIQCYINGSTKAVTTFGMGGRDEYVENVSIRGVGGQYTIKTYNSVGGSRAFGMGNVNNFLIADFICEDEFSKFSCMEFTLSKLGPDYIEGRYAHNGIVENSKCLNTAYGYGFVQLQAAKNILFRDIDGDGGATIRCETGWVTMNDLQIGGIDKIYGRNIIGRNGKCAVMISPHSMQNGLVDIDGVKSYSCSYGVTIDGGYVAPRQTNPNLTPGTFSSVTVKNILAEFGTTAQIKPKDKNWIPYYRRDLLTGISQDGGQTQIGPAIAAVRFDDHNYKNKVTVNNIVACGFACQKDIVNQDDKNHTLDCANPDYSSGCIPDSDIAVVSVNIQETVISLEVGATRTLSATISPDNATDQSVKWSTNNSSIAIVNQNSGKVTAIKKGSAVITIKTNDGNKTDSYTVNVTENTSPPTGSSTETLNQIPTAVGKWITTSYTGNNSIEWTPNGKVVTNINGSKGLFMKAGVTGITSEPIQGGISSFSVTCLDLHDAGVTRTIELLINGNVVGSMNHTGSDVYTFSVDNMNITGDVTITLKNATTGTNMKIVYDDITWTSYTPSSTIASPIGSVIWLKGSNDQYISSENGAKAMNCNRTTLGEWEKFTVVDAGGGLIALQGSNGKYVSSGTANMMCASASIGTYEKFTWEEQSNDVVALKGNNNKYVSSENGIVPMISNRAAIGTWEVFTWGTTIARKSAVDKSVAAELIKVYPNPATDVLNIAINTVAENARVTIVNSIGAAVYSSEYTGDPLQISKLTQGIYFIKLNVNNTTVTKMFIKQ